MALTKCPDCGKEVSTFAKDCLGCGRPVAGFSEKEADPTIEVTKKIDFKGNTAIASLVVGGIVTGGAYYFLGDMNFVPWWGYVLFFLVSAGAFFNGMIEAKANETIVDMGDNK